VRKRCENSLGGLCSVIKLNHCVVYIVIMVCLAKNAPMYKICYKYVSNIYTLFLGGSYCIF